MPVCLTASLHSPMPVRMSATIGMTAVGALIAMGEMVAAGMDIGVDMPVPAFSPGIVPVVGMRVADFGGIAQPSSDTVIQPAVAVLVMAFIAEIFWERLGRRGDRRYVQGRGLAFALAIPPVHPVLDFANPVTVIDRFFFVFLIVLVVRRCRYPLVGAKGKGRRIIRTGLAARRKDGQAHKE